LEVSGVPFYRFTRRLLFLAALTFVLLPRLAAAHAILEASEPAAGARVPAGPVKLTLRYNSRVDRARSGLTLTHPDQSKTSLRIDPEGPPDVLTSTVTLTAGAYVVRWQVLAIDGHITRGDVAFTVTGP
jgi:methionine-rich copper-binding protein CopC